MVNVLSVNQKNYTLSTFPSNNGRNCEDSGKVLAVYVSEFYQSIAVQLYQPTPIKVGSHDPIFSSNYSSAHFSRQQLDV